MPGCRGPDRGRTDPIPAGLPTPAAVPPSLRRPHSSVFLAPPFGRDMGPAPEGAKHLPPPPPVTGGPVPAEAAGDPRLQSRGHGRTPSPMFRRGIYNRLRASPAGSMSGGLGACAAALAAARLGRRVVLPDEHPRIEEFGATAGYHAPRQGIRDHYRA